MNAIVYGAVSFAAQVWEGNVCMYCVHAAAARIGGRAAHVVQLLQPLAHLVDLIDASARMVLSLPMEPIVAALRVRDRGVRVMIFSALKAAIEINLTIMKLIPTIIFLPFVVPWAIVCSSLDDIKDGEKAAKKFLAVGKLSGPLVQKKIKIYCIWGAIFGGNPSVENRIADEAQRALSYIELIREQQRIRQQQEDEEDPDPELTATIAASLVQMEQGLDKPLDGTYARFLTTWAKKVAEEHPALDPSDTEGGLQSFMHYLQLKEIQINNPDSIDADIFMFARQKKLTEISSRR